MPSTRSFRDVEDLAERGIDVSSETIHRWFLKFGRLIARNLRRDRLRPNPRWHLAEMVIRFLVKRRRCARSARELLRKLLKRHGLAPKRITTESSSPIPSPFANSSCPRSMITACGPTIGPRTPISRYGGENENSSGPSHRDPPNGSCRSTPPLTTPFISNAFLSRRIFKEFRATTFAVWRPSCRAA